MGSLSKAEEAQLKAQLEDAVISCNERCLYQSAKWYVLEYLRMPIHILMRIRQGGRAAQFAA